mmetsp:Transcript_10041/g.34730  ORF Transcript_10041/g.34730 Transcript_10041/m.34730 type:complete len:208 (+) Transcript_10041:580-1203(+)
MCVSNSETAPCKASSSGNPDETCIALPPSTAKYVVLAAERPLWPRVSQCAVSARPVRFLRRRSSSTGCNCSAETLRLATPVSSRSTQASKTPTSFWCDEPRWMHAWASPRPAACCALATAARASAGSKVNSTARPPTRGGGRAPCKKAAVERPFRRAVSQGRWCGGRLWSVPSSQFPLCPTAAMFRSMRASSPTGRAAQSRSCMYRT